MKMAKTLEVHEHCYITGPNAGHWAKGKFSHSHADSDVPHSHPRTGPSAYTIDKDDWFRSTGLTGGGRKVFTAKPRGPQLAFIARTPEQQTFEVIVGTPPRDYKGDGPGLALPLRIMKTFGMRPIVKRA